MWIELLLSCVPLFICCLCWRLQIDEVMLLLLTSFSSSIAGFFLWAYSRYLADVYQEESILRMSIRREQLISGASIPSLEKDQVGSNLCCSADGCKNTKESSENRVLFGQDELQKCNLPRRVLRLSPVFPAFLAVVQGMVCVTTVFIASFLVSRIAVTTE